ncbi:hypothetical protein ACVINW_005620 [Bradyrhizobium sp. USDA 4461]
MAGKRVVFTVPSLRGARDKIAKQFCAEAPKQSIVPHMWSDRLPRCARNDDQMEDNQVTITVFIRYQLDPFKRAMFEEYSRNWLSIIPRCGGDLIGYWMPHEGTNNIGFALISFESLAAYETYRARLRQDKEAMANFNFAEENRFILAEERTFLRKVEL